MASEWNVFTLVYVPFLPQRYKDRVITDSIAEKELKHCFVEWEEQASFQDGKLWSASKLYLPKPYVCTSLLGEQQKSKGVYKYILSLREIKEAETA